MIATDRLAPLKYFILTFICQFVAIAFVGGLAPFGPPYLLLFILHSLISGFLAFFFRLPRPWIFVNCMIPAGILVSQAFPGYGWIWFILMITFGMLFLPTFWTRVPYYPSSEKVYELLTSQLPADKQFRFLDIGCGNARLISYLAKQFPAAEFEGIDLSPSAILAAKYLSFGQKNVKVSLGNYWNKYFGDYDFIYAFLSPTPMPQVEQKFSREMKDGCSLLVNSFALPNIEPALKLTVNHQNQTELLIYVHDSTNQKEQPPVPGNSAAQETFK